MRRLAIIDLETGDQPVANEARRRRRGRQRRALQLPRAARRARREGHTSSGATGDVELVPHLYEEHGERFVERLRGMFALALWDESRERLAARARPLRDQAALPRRARGRRARVRVRAARRCSRSAPPPSRGPRGRRRLPRARLRVGRADGAPRRAAARCPARLLVHERRAHARGALVDARSRREAPVEETLAGRSAAPALGRAARRAPLRRPRLVADRVARGRRARGAAADLHRRVRRRRARRARAGARGRAGDRHAATRSCSSRRTSPTTCRRSPPRSSSRSPTRAAIPLWYLCRAVAAEVKVALAGDGGDEVFGGYSRYAWDPVAARLRLLAPLGRLVPERGGRKSVVRRASKLLRHAAKPEAARYLSWFALTDGDARAHVFERLFAEAPDGLTKLGRLQWVDLQLVRRRRPDAEGRQALAWRTRSSCACRSSTTGRRGGALPGRRREGARRADEGRDPPARRAPARRGDRAPAEAGLRPVPVERWLRGELRDLAGDALASLDGLVDRHARRARDAGAGVRVDDALALASRPGVARA